MNQADIVELIKLFDGSDISKLKIKNDDFLIELEKKSETIITATPTQVVSNAPQVTESVKETATPIETKPKSAEVTINSPMVGTFYKAPSPTAPAFSKVGDKVKKGQTIAIIEAMKVMNELEAEFDCKIVDILVEDGQPVQFDMPLFEVEKI